MLQQYHKDIPIILRCRTPTNSDTITNIATFVPPEKKNKKKNNKNKNESLPSTSKQGLKSFRKWNGSLSNDDGGHNENATEPFEKNNRSTRAF